MSVVGIILLIIIVPLLAALVITQLLGANAAADFPRTGKVTKVRNGKIHWVEKGDGPPVVLIHGLGGNLMNFTYALTDKLAETHRVIALDRPGCGWSERDGEAQATLQEQARMIAEFIDAEGLGKPTVVGHSLGGGIAMTMGINHADQVGALALICPATKDVADTPDAFKGIDIPSAGVRKVIAHTIAGAMGLLMEKKVFEAVFAPEPVAPNFAMQGGARMGRMPDAFIAASEDLTQGRASAPAMVNRESEITVPVGVLYAAEDQILDPALHGEAFAEAAGAELKILPDRGHMIPLTAPEDCAAFIRGMAAKA